MADLVDNSISAGAHRVDITIEFEGADSWIRIADDGRGMNSATITEAMRYGSSRDYEENDLGKFGLGLKTASMSQCRRLTVGSRPSRNSRRAEVRQWDLDYIEEHNEWDVLILGRAERPSRLTEALERRRGTVVLWEHLDRILTYQDPAGGWARKHLLNLAGRVEKHLSMVFHRFLAGEVSGRRRLVITVNENELEPWDPFARDEPATEVLPPVDVPLDTSEGSGIVRMEPFVLPPKASFSSEAKWRLLSGPDQWNRQQGFYIYRSDRLIQSGGWSRLRTSDEHTKLARIGLTFGPDLDSSFGINVAKMRVSLPSELSELIEDDVTTYARRAQTVYRAKPDVPSPGGARRGSHSGHPTNGGGDQGGGPVEPSARREALMQAASQANEQRAFQRVIRQLKSRDPRVARDLGW